MKGDGIMSIVSFRRSDVTPEEFHRMFLKAKREGVSTPDKDCPDLVAEYERAQKNKVRKTIVASGDGGSNNS